MNSPLKLIIGIGSVALAAGLAAWALESKSASPAAASSLPRYALTVGQELVYEGASSFEYAGGSFKTTDLTTLWVVRQNPNGSWHVVAHNVNTDVQTRSSGNGKPAERRAETFDAFDLFPDGRVDGLRDPVTAARLLAALFRLPADATAGEQGWTVEEPGGDQSAYRLLPGVLSGHTRSLEKTGRGLMNEVYLATARSVGTFDLKRGLIVRIEAANSQGWGGFNGKGTGTLTLKSTDTKRPEWIAQLARESDVLLKARAAVAEARQSLHRGASAAEATAAATQALLAGRKDATLPLIAAQFDAQLKQVEDSVGYFASKKAREDKVLNQPSPSWETTDLDGGKHTLAGYRGKVVVLDFWYRGCGWCIRAMPQIKELAEHYRGHPVAVLGMNTDRKEEDARFVMAKLQLNYPTLRGTGVPEKYGVTGFPTLVVIDPQGVVRKIHVGYSPTLRDELIKVIDGLLAGETSGHPKT